MINPIFRLIQDKFKLYDSPQEENHTIIVNDDKSYVRSRVMIETIKEQDRFSKIEIVIQNENYFNLYQDIKELGALTKLVKIDPLKAFKEKFNYEIPISISAQFLINNNLLEEVDDFNHYYNVDYDFKTNLLLYRLQLKTISLLSNKYSLLRFIIDYSEKIKILKNNRSLFEIFTNKVFNKIEEKDLVQDIKEAIINDELNNYLEFLLASHIFSHYQEYNFNTFLSDLDYDYKNLNLYYRLAQEDELVEFYKRLYLNNENFLKTISNYLKSQQDKVDIFADKFEYSKYLDNISGYLDYELDYLIKNLLNDLITKEVDKYYLSLLSKIEKKFAPLFNFEKALKNFNMFKKLLNLLYKLRNIVDLDNNFADWTTFYREEYLDLNNNLEEEKNIFNIIEKLAGKYNLNLSSVKVKVETELNEINRQYEEYLINNYESLVNSEENLGICSKLEEIKRIMNRGTPVIMIVIDAMRWDMWDIISSIFEKYGFVMTNKQDEVTLSLIPSVTDISRRSLFAGMNYSDLQQKKVSGQFTHGIHNEAKHLQRYFVHNKISFAKGGKKAFKELITEKADLYSFIFTEGDEMFHGFKDINSELITVLFENQVKNIAETISKSDYLTQAKIVVTTDHGSIKIAQHQSYNLNKNFKDYLKSKDLMIESHGRYLKVYGKEFIEEEYQEVKKHLLQMEDDYWHIIDRDTMKSFYLPKTDVNGENYFWLISKYGYYPGACRGDYTHGGVSMSETIIPFAILEKKESTFNIPELQLIHSELVAEKESQLELLLVNNNNYPLRDLVLEFAHFGITEEIGFMSRNDSLTFQINLLPNESGEIEEEINLNFNFAGKHKQLNKSLSLTIEDSSKSRINKSLKESRELF
ncbi:MAG: hypothetical protein AWU54_1932 [Candidatus Frackibacter sp. T328-2]|nr:MAG: hypothetical protein AWU54_1932 [Candidatus Frackibacter sp. T328-2]